MCTEKSILINPKNLSNENNLLKCTYYVLCFTTLKAILTNWTSLKQIVSHLTGVFTLSKVYQYIDI